MHAMQLHNIIRIPEHEMTTITESSYFLFCCSLSPARFLCQVEFSVCLYVCEDWIWMPEVVMVLFGFVCTLHSMLWWEISVEK